MLKFSDLCQYLPYGLLVQYEKTDWVLDGLIFGNGKAILCKDDDQKYDIPISQIKPYFRPTSQLVEEIEHDGQRFVPIVELAKIKGYTPKGNFDSNSGIGIYWCELLTPQKKNTDFTFLENSFYISEWDSKFNSRILNCLNQNSLFDKLIEWHFWLGDQSYFDKKIILPIKPQTNE